MDSLCRPAMAWGYARVSDFSQIKQDDSIPAQIERIEGLYRFKLAPIGVNWARIVADPVAVSASKRAFSLRRAGAELMNCMQPGDHLIIDKLDRLSRQQKDLYDTLDWFEKHDIELHICMLLGTNVDTKSMLGRFMIGFLGLMAEFEAAQLAERRNAQNIISRKSGRALTCWGPPGTETFKRKDSTGKVRTYVRWDLKRRALMQEVVRRIDGDHHSFQQVADAFDRDYCLAHGYEFKKSAFAKRKYSAKKIWRWYMAEKFYQQHNITDVADIPLDLKNKIRRNSL